MQKKKGTYEDKRDKDISVKSREEPSNDGHDADGDAGQAEESDGRGDSHLAAQAVALKSELVQHVSSFVLKCCTSLHQHKMLEINVGVKRFPFSFF